MTDHDQLIETIKARGAFDGPLNDYALDDLIDTLVVATDVLHQHLDFAGWPFSRQRIDLESFCAVLAGIDHAVNAMTRLVPLLRIRQHHVEAMGVPWRQHLEDLEAWHDACEQRRAA